MVLRLIFGWTRRFRISERSPAAIESSVVEGRMEFIPGTIDSWRWVETPHRLTFLGEDVLSTDSSEGVVTLTLNY